MKYVRSGTSVHGSTVWASCSRTIAYLNLSYNISTYERPRALINSESQPSTGSFPVLDTIYIFDILRDSRTTEDGEELSNAAIQPFAQ
jgi:hypothetical protein